MLLLGITDVAEDLGHHRRRGVADPAEHDRGCPRHRQCHDRDRRRLPRTVVAAPVVPRYCRRPARISATGVRQGLSVALILMVISEMFASSSGLGYRIVYFQRNYLIPESWSGIVLLGLTGVALAVLFWVRRATCPPLVSRNAGDRTWLSGTRCYGSST